MRRASMCSILSVTLMVGCQSAPPDEPGAIASALELENGGYDESAEDPGEFAEDVEEEDGEPSEDFAVDDAMDGAGLEMERLPGARRVDVLLAWGQPPGERAAIAPRTWDGELSLDGGAIRVRRALRFERRTDHVLPRDAASSLAFASTTGPGHDGLVLRLIARRGSDPLTLVYTSHSGEAASIAVRDLFDGPVVVSEDESGNRMIAVAIDRERDACHRAFMIGRSERDGEGHGRYRARIVSDDGELVGHVRGIFGERESGERVFFGKAIDRDGNTRGLLRGTFDGDGIDARIRLRDGEIGSVEGLRGRGGDGQFIARLTQTSCEE